MSADRCFWPNDDDNDVDDDECRGGRPHSRQSDHRGGSSAINDGLLAASVSSKSSSSTMMITGPAKSATLVESVLRVAASMLASFALGADILVGGGGNTSW